MRLVTSVDYHPETTFSMLVEPASDERISLTVKRFLPGADGYITDNRLLFTVGPGSGAPTPEICLYVLEPGDPDPISNNTPTLGEVRSALLAVKTLHGRQDAVFIVRTFGGADEVAAIPIERYRTVVDVCRMLLKYLKRIEEVTS